jgi:uncharacterized protein YggT (Ycf19 family)
MWTIIGRGILFLLIGDRPNVIMSIFVKVTEPAYRIVKRILPFVSDKWIPLVTIVIIIILRILLLPYIGKEKLV